MIFTAFRIYHLTKKATRDGASAAVVDEIKKTVTAALVIPLIVITIIIVFLGILGFTHLIAHASLIARIFFWILFVIGIMYGAAFLVIRNLMKRIFMKN